MDLIFSFRRHYLKIIFFSKNASDNWPPFLQSANPFTEQRTILLHTAQYCIYRLAFPFQLKWIKIGLSVHAGRYLLTVAIKSFGTDYLVMVLAPGIDNTGDPGSGDHIGHCSPCTSCTAWLESWAAGPAVFLAGAGCTFSKSNGDIAKTL